MSHGKKGIRAGTRISVQLPVEIRWKNPDGVERLAQGKTDSMSGNGLFIVAPVRLRHNMPIAFTIMLPAEITKVPMQLHCVGRVIRRQRTETSDGLAVVIDDYHLSAAKTTV